MGRASKNSPCRPALRRTSTLVICFPRYRFKPRRNITRKWPLRHDLLEALGKQHEFHRILSFTVDPHLIVEMRSSRAPRSSSERDRLAALNLSAYLHWADDTLAEPQFFNALAQRSGCGLLLDVNNLVVNALNADRDEARAVLAA